ncbi:hypothetical protein [Chryseobacterium salivictor]|uniref:Lipoprotein n=1 Tax=Chryseobacterium salivictor TaxID=2547600 RepID=A0A4P6ZIF6_9FLAO|nr:hypothetical protein [Chryseobacterium salivictor]QBO59513.1 hypothetical protein NBC122_02712 [Chryseobacterium salivictor]
MAGNIKILKICVLLCLSIGCNNLHDQQKIGKNIINDNANLFISNLYNVSLKNEKIFIRRKVGGKDFIVEHCESIEEMKGLNLVENCKKDLFNFINKEGFDINEKTNYTSFDLDEFYSRNNIKIEDSEGNIKEKEYVEVIFSNFFIDNKKGKAFIIVQENNFKEGRYGGKTEIYFFKKNGDNWEFYKIEMLLTA